MFRIISTLFVLMIIVFAGFMLYNSHQSKVAKAKRESLKLAGKQDNRPDYLKIKGLDDALIFRDMQNDDAYYRDVVRNPNDYHHLVYDERIYDRNEVALIYQYHCYHFFLFKDSMDDMKSDFLSAFLLGYHKVPQVDVDKLAIDADEYAHR